MRIHMYVTASNLKRYKDGEEVTARLYSQVNAIHDDNDIHVDVHEDEVVHIYPSGFATLRGREK